MLQHSCSSALLYEGFPDHVGLVAKGAAPFMVDDVGAASSALPHLDTNATFFWVSFCHVFTSALCAKLVLHQPGMHRFCCCNMALLTLAILLSSCGRGLGCCLTTIEREVARLDFVVLVGHVWMMLLFVYHRSIDRVCLVTCM